MPNAVNVVFAIALVSRMLVSKYDAMGYLQRQHLQRGPMSQEQVDLIKNGAIGRYLRRRGAKAAEALDAALWEFHKQEYITLPSTYRRARLRNRSAVEVLAACEDWLDERCTANDWKNVTARAARHRFAKHHKKAGGDGREDLTQCINDKLLSLAFQDRLQRVTKSGGPPEAMSMFAGTQSTTAPFMSAGYSAVWNAELTQDIDMGLLFDNAMVQYPIDLSNYFNGKRGELVAKVVAAWPRAKDKNLSLLAAGIPCRTFVMNQCNRERSNHFRSTNGNPRSSQSCDTDAHTAKRQLAMDHDDLAEDVMDSICDWLLSGALTGKQRHFIVENPARSMLWNRPYMKQFCDLSGCHRQNVNYCCYRVSLLHDCVYPCLKDTSILTNIKGWQPRKCPDRRHHAAHTCKIAGPDGEDEPEFLGIPKAACRYMTPEELYLDLAVAARS